MALIRRNDNEPDLVVRCSVIDWVTSIELP